MSKLEPVLFVPDCHIPYHDKKAFALMMAVAKDLKPKHIYIIGDFIDFYSVSSHSKNPKRSLQLADELKAAETALDQLDALKAPNKTYIGGNHEDRLQRYLQDKAPELFDVVNVPDLLHLKKHGWDYVPYKKDTKLGKIHFTHDVGASGRNSVYKSLDTYQHSVVTGHSHRLAYIVEGNATGEFKVSAQFGWLGDANEIDYMQHAKVLKDWALGFGIGYYNPDSKLVYLTPVPIVNYTAVVNGKLYIGKK
jgi:predicted MPP superfamily phosphohydrolase